MARPTFDTLRAVRKLRGSGMDEEPAGAVVEVVGDATSPLVTLEMLQSEFRAQQLRLGGMFVVATGIILAALAIAAGAVIQAIG